MPTKYKNPKLVGILFVMLIFFSFFNSFQVRAEEQKFALVEIHNPQDIQLLKAIGAEIVQEYGTYVLVAYPTDEILQNIMKSFPKGKIKKIDYSLEFAKEKVDEISLEKINLKQRTLSEGIYVIQLIGPATPEWMAELKSVGKILAYIPNYAYIVKIKNSTSFSTKLFIKGVYPYNPEWKMGKGLIKKLGESAENETIRIAVILDPTISDPVAVAKDLAAKYGVAPEEHPSRIGKVIIDTLGELKYKFYGRIKVGNINALLSDPRVVIIDYAPEVKIFNSMAAKIVGVELAREDRLNGLKVNLTGAGQVVAIADTGLDTGDPANIVEEFAGRVLTIYDAAGDGDPSDPDNADLGGHGTHVAGSVAGSGVLSGADPVNHKYNGSFAGMAPEAFIHFESIGTVTIQGGGLAYDSITNMATRAYNDGARIWTNSWGASDNSYSTDAQEVDQFMWNYKDFLVLFAAGNEGPGPNTVGSPATAKNIITVGATENLVPHVGGEGFNQYSMSDNPDQLAYFSSRGPTADGRIKPDLVAPGAGIVSVRATTVSDSNLGATWIIPTDNNGDGKFDYIAMQGTSMATPVAAGTMVLIRQYFTDYEELSDPSAALLKATALVGTDILPGYVFGGYDQGWGRLNIAGSLFPEPPLAFKYWDWQSVDNGGVWQQTINVVNSSEPLRVVLVWTDYPGSTTASVALVNDLDLVVIAPDGTEYHGNIIDNLTSVSIPNPTNYDRRNNVEVVRIENPQVGTWTIKVIGYNIAQDDPDGPNALDQTFALAVRGPIGPQKQENTKLTRERIDSNEWTYDELTLTLTPGASAYTTIRVTNWGQNTHTYDIGYYTNSPDIIILLNATSVTLNPGESVLVSAVITVDSSVTSGLYDVEIYAADENGYRQTLRSKVAVIYPVPFPRNQVSHTLENTTMETTSSIAVDPTDGSLWIAYFRQDTDRQGNPYTDTRLGNGDNFDLIIAHSTDGGKTWTEYVALKNFDRYYNYGGSEEQVIDWFYWYPQIDVDSSGKVYVAFSTLESVYVVYGDENGFSYTRFEDAYYSSSTDYEMVYPWVTVVTTGPGQAMVIYTLAKSYDGPGWWNDATYRALKYVYTTDGGATWSTPTLINSAYSTTTDDVREYMASATFDGSRVWVFFVGRNPANGENYYRLQYYYYEAGTWYGPYDLYGDSTTGPSIFYPSAFTDSSGRVWVAFYEPTASFNSFGVTSWAVKLMYYDGSWNGPYQLDDYSTYAYPPAMSEFVGKIWVGYSEVSYYGANSPIFNNAYPYSTYALKVAAFDPSINSVVEYRYISPGGLTNFHLDGDNEAHNGVYYSYTTTLEWLNDEVMVVAYNGTSYTFEWPTPMNNTKTDLSWVKIELSTEYPVDGITLQVTSSGGTTTYPMNLIYNNRWGYNVTNLNNGTYMYMVSIEAIGETITSPARALIVDTAPPTYVSDILDGDPTDWVGKDSLVSPDSAQILDGTLIWKDAVDAPLYNAEIVKIRADESYLYMLINITDLRNLGYPNNAYIEINFDVNSDGTYDYRSVIDLSQYNVRSNNIKKLNLFNLSNNQNLGDLNTLFIASESNDIIELQIPRSLIGNPQGDMGVSVKVYDTSGAGEISRVVDVMTDGGNEYTVFSIANVPMFSSIGLAILLGLLVLYWFRRD